MVGGAVAAVGSWCSRLIIAAQSGRQKMSRLILSCLAAGLVWIVVESIGGLLFLWLGVRLWQYELMPIWSQITSPIVWGLAAILIVPLQLTFDRLLLDRIQLRTGMWHRTAFTVVAGCSLEVALNEWLFKSWIGQPLFTYVVLPTFNGSGSWLSPLYYLTLTLHLPVTSRILRVT